MADEFDRWLERELDAEIPPLDTVPSLPATARYRVRQASGWRRLGPGMVMAPTLLLVLAAVTAVGAASAELNGNVPLTLPAVAPADDPSDRSTPTGTGDQRPAGGPVVTQPAPRAGQRSPQTGEDGGRTQGSSAPGGDQEREGMPSSPRPRESDSPRPKSSPSAEPRVPNQVMPPPNPSPS